MDKMNLPLSLAAVIIVMLCSHFGDDASAKVKLKARIPELCYGCHDGLKKGLEDPHVHFLFKQGKCITCHNTHVSDVEGLLHGETNSVCLKCHEALRNRMREGFVHNVVRRGSCSDCHEAHSSQHSQGRCNFPRRH